MKIHSMGAKFVRTDGRTDRHDDANCRLRTRPETCSRNYLKIVRATRVICSMFRSENPQYYAPPHKIY
jgi:hypothetical protein